ncbi:MAG: TrbG/VirB9 family P-type conjugative transfer protein [Phycisphaerales bacterium]|nr:TrbG/VirB9 family P-type conjugative transfer protein [Hyphomonadaceae bacterium]
MIRLQHILGLVLATWLSIGLAWAQSDADPRIRSVLYDPDAVVRLVGHFDYQMMIEFAPGERIENVSIGDALSWQVTPNRAATLLFVKPIDEASSTNMTVVTDVRRYTFELTARRAGSARAGEMTYVLRFTYPPAPAQVQGTDRRAPPERRNTAYTYTGSRAALPATVFDDGQFTYFQWQDGGSTPALLLLQDDGSEAIANYGYRDGYLIVEHLARRFRLRNGSDVTTIINQGWREPGVGASAPQPNDARTAREAEQGG